MFGFIPGYKRKDNSLEIDAFDARKEGDQLNIDIIRVTTVDKDGDRLTTQFGIQGRSDHLAKARLVRRAKADKLADASFTMEVDTNAVENDIPLEVVA
jgi:hypothetical protein